MFIVQVSWEMELLKLVELYWGDCLAMAGNSAIAQRDFAQSLLSCNMVLKCM